MSDTLVLLTLIAEALMILMCLHIAFERKVRFSRNLLGIVCVDGVMFALINVGLLPQMCSVLIYVLFWVYCFLTFKQTVLKTTIQFVIGATVGCSVEVLISFVAIPFQEEYDSHVILFVISYLALILVYVTGQIIPKLKGKIKFRKEITRFLIIAVYGMALASMIVDYYLNDSVIDLYVAVIFSCLIVLHFYQYKLEQARIEVEKKNCELELERIYGGTYKELLAAVRRRQHDFKNQLSAIYSMHLVAKSLDELVEMQKSYGDYILEECKYDAILTGCNQPILAGYLYYKCIACEKAGIDVHYNIRIDQAESEFSMHELIELLGIFIDNACEQLLRETTLPQNIKLDFREEERGIQFSIANPAAVMTSAQIDKMFQKGYSTKGDNRGIGLARALELVRKNKAEIQVKNQSINDENWIEFTIMITKE